MTSLEALLKKEKIEKQALGLINGDRLSAILSSSGASFKDKVFFVTEQGDFYYTDKDEDRWSVYQVIYDREKGALVQDERSHVQRTSEEEPFVTPERQRYDAQEVIKSLHKMAEQAGEHPFVSDETCWFRQQLFDLAEENGVQQVKEDELWEAIKGYVPSKNSVAPFGRDSVERLVLKRDGGRRHGKRWHRPITASEAERIVCAAKDLEKKKLSGDEQYMLKKDFLDDYLIGRHVTTDAKNLRVFLQEHELDNSSERRTHMYEPQSSKDHWQFRMPGDPRLHIILTQGKPGSTYVREPLDLKPLFRKKWHDTIRGWWGKKKRSFRKSVRHVRRHGLAYGLSLALLASAGSFFKGQHYGARQERERTEQIIEEPVKRPVFEKKTVQVQEPYIVRKGDCLWNIAKKYAGDSDRDVLEKTDEIATENGMLTISEYEQKRAGGETVAKQENPNLIYPGDTLRVSQEREVVVENKSPKESVDAAVAEPVEEEKEDVGHVLYAPPVQRRMQERYVPRTTGVVQEKERVEQPVDYVGVLQAMVRMKNSGSSLDEIAGEYAGFRDRDDVRKAFADYQGFVQSGVITQPDVVDRYDGRVANTDFKCRVVHEYQRGKGTLSEIRRDLKKEYGMDVSESTISRYARQALGVGSRKAARRRLE
ncbi:LysM peptidoglycan-binding domain-containing protein [Candidatus Woesearchaeota archaeon]|nr:LysM peptidoglycan-binding domain-containing protein [Candidatus Woesearchaeota archaeon]